VTSLDMVLTDIWAAPSLAADLSKRWPYKVENWQETNSQLLQALNAQSVSTKMIRGFVLLVVALGIASVLVVSVVQKRREIGILRAMGATQGQVLRIFLLQGTLVGLIGSMPLDSSGCLLPSCAVWMVHRCSSLR
jgi:lipoprotein-releasing system permease protein